MKKRVAYYILIAIYLIYCIFYIINICNYGDFKMQFYGFAFMSILLFLYCLKKHDFEEFIMKLFVIFILVTIFPFYYRYYFYKHHGLAVIRSAVVIGVGSKGVYSDIKFRYHKSYIKETIYRLSKYKKGTKIFVIDPVECSSPEYKEFIDTTKYSQIHDFAFLDDTTFYTYHDFSLIKPDFVYYQEGFNVVYKATFDGNYLHFFDVCEKNRKVKYSINNDSITNVLDTFLVYRNINEEIDDRFIVCAPEINTPENWSKISDYGYIFHSDIYRKEEIETQCPQIKNYVEKFKEREYFEPKIIHNPDLIYLEEGYNIVYKAATKLVKEKFEYLDIHFTDICNNNITLKKVCNSKNIIPDTILIYRNINEKIEKGWRFCPAYINIPENWSKIIDYGYFYRDDIYSKEEIETQCPQIKNYVEKFKERNINSNEN